MRKLILIALLLAGCSNPFDKFAQVFPGLRGQPIGVLYDRWGPPERVVEAETARRVEEAQGNTPGGGPIYVWNSKTSATYTNRSTSTGYVGTTPVSITTTSPEVETYYCNMRVKTNADRRIVDIAVSGARGACSQFADRL